MIVGCSVLLVDMFERRIEIGLCYVELSGCLPCSVVLADIPDRWIDSGLCYVELSGCFPCYKPM